MHSQRKIQHNTQDASAAFALLEARGNGLQRLVQALFREKLLHAEHLIFEGATAWLPLWSQQAMLRFDGLQLGRIGNCQLSGLISYYRTGEQPQPVPTASALLARVVPAIAGTASADLQRLVAELDNSTDNDALCLNFRSGWTRRLQSALGSVPGGGQQNFIAALRSSGERNPALLLEQWGALGHPWHPNHKTKLGLNAEDVVALSPEFAARLAVPVAALREDVAQLAFSADGMDYQQWFAHHFPEAWQRWATALQAAGHGTDGWLPLPLHPFQASRVIGTQFADELHTGKLLLLPGVEIDATPTMSFRTVVPQTEAGTSATAPHIKLPVSLRLTSVQRTVSPKSAVMGPRLTRMIRSILADEQGFGQTLAIVGEEVGLHYLDPQGDDDRSRHLSVLYRANPMAGFHSHDTAGCLPLPVGALFAESPLNQRPLVTDLVAPAFGDHAQGARDFFQCYAAVALQAMLAPYLLYGIAFEAHQQNSFIVVDEQHRPVQLLVRDFGDLRIHAPTLRHAGRELAAYRAGHTLFDDAQPVRDKLMHAFLLCHLSELALLLARSYHQPEADFWNILATEIARIFDALRPHTDAERWQAERHALLEADWPAKSFVRMRLADSADDVVLRMPNPLKQPA